MNPSVHTQNPTVELYGLLLQIPSIFGRLIHIAGLWNPETRRYDRELPERFRNVGLDQALTGWHQAFFMEWLALSLTQQQRDVSVYWTSAGRTPEHLKRIRDLGERAIPPLVEWAERRSFSQNLAFIQNLLQHELDKTGRGQVGAAGEQEAVRSSYQASDVSGSGR